jgi:DNA segregation ATPase FtsK/SpoIIIE-like protein
VLKDDSAMFTNVLHNSNVTNSLRGRESSLITRFSLRPPAFSNFFRYILLSENIAVSLPEKKAERATSNIR